MLPALPPPSRFIKSLCNAHPRQFTNYHSFLRVTSCTTPPTHPCQYSHGRVSQCRTISSPPSVTSPPTPSTPSVSRRTQALGRGRSLTLSKLKPNREVSVLQRRRSAGTEWGGVCQEVLGVLKGMGGAFQW